MKKSIRALLPQVAFGVAIVGVSVFSQVSVADYQYPNSKGTVYELNFTDVATVLGATGASGLPTNASSSSDELIGMFQNTAISANGSGPNLVPNGTVLNGMFGDLGIIEHLRPVFTGNTITGYTVINDITPGTAPLNFQNNDLLFFGALGRNPLTNAGDPDSGGYLLLTDNKTGFSYNAVGQGANENPQGLSLKTGGFSVSNSGVATNNDNYTNATPGTAVDPNHVVLAAKFQDLSTMTGVVPPAGITDPLEIGGNSILPPGTLFVEQGTTPVSSTDPTALTAQSFFFLNVVGGSSAGSFLQDATFTPGNTAGSVPYGGTAEVSARISTNFNVTAPPGYTQFQGSGDDPANYFGSGVPEPSSIVLLSIGLASFGAARIRRRLRKEQQPV